MDEGYDGRVIAVNFKTYPQGTGLQAVKLAEICRRVGHEYGVRIVAIPQIADLRACVETGAECWMQHIDAEAPGKNTGYVILEDVIAEGAKGTLLNHSEHRLEPEVLKKTCDRIAGVRNEFEVCICVQNAEEAEKYSQLNPGFIAYEPPELIGSRDKSVTTERPEVIKQVTGKVKTAVLIGAGVHTGADVRTGLSLGAAGILLASDIMLAEDPEKELRELAEAFGKSVHSS